MARAMREIDRPMEQGKKLHEHVLSFFFFLFKKVHLGINRKMLKGYNEFIQYITTLISTSTRMSSIKSPHESWGRLAKEIQNYEKEYGEFLLLSDGRHVLEISNITSVHCLEEDMVWSTISSLVVWVLWKAR